MVKLRESNLGHEAIRSLVRQVMATEKASYAGIRMRCVAIEQSGSWVNGLCHIEGILNQDTRQKTPSIEYKGFHLLEQWIEPHELQTILDGVVQGALTVSEHQISIDNQQRFTQWEQIPSENIYSHFPGQLFTTQSSSTLSFGNNGPLLSADNPFYANPYLAIRDWIRFRNFNLGNDSRLGTIHLFLPQSRAYFDQIIRKGDELVFKVEGSARNGLRVKGAWEFSSSLEQIDLPLQGTAGTLPWVGNSAGLEFYLIGQDATIYDFHRETDFWSINHRRLFGTRGQESEGSRAVERLLLQGEGEQTEFKPYIRPDHTEKFEEVVKTTIAFANTKGGSIILGVDNACEVLGVEKEIGKAFRDKGRTIEGSYERYKGSVRQAIAGKLNRTLEITMDYVLIQGHKVLQIEVPEGNRKPYWHHSTHQVYVRRGANTVKAHPEHDLPRLLNSPSTTTQLFGQDVQHE